MAYLFLFLTSLVPLRLGCDFSHPLACDLRRTLVPGLLEQNRVHMSSSAHFEALCVQGLSLLTDFFTSDYLLVPIHHTYKFLWHGSRSTLNSILTCLRSVSSVHLGTDTERRWVFVLCSSQSSKCCHLTGLHRYTAANPRQTLNAWFSALALKMLCSHLNDFEIPTTNFLPGWLHLYCHRVSKLEWLICKRKI